LADCDALRRFADCDGRRRLGDRVERPFWDRERELADAFAVRRFAVELDELDERRRLVDVFVWAIFPPFGFVRSIPPAGGS
jgi:hypothetical protein